MGEGQWSDDVTLDDGPIQIRVSTLGRLFSPIDPAPLKLRALRDEVATWIQEWADDIDRHRPLDIEIHVADGSADGHEDAVAHAIEAHFEYRRWQLARQLKGLWREGRISLLIGLSALVLLTSASQLVGEGSSRSIAMLHDGLAILGWVAMWKPLNIFLYEWWPIRRERRLCHRIARATITFPVPAQDEGGTP